MEVSVAFVRLVAQFVHLLLELSVAFARLVAQFLHLVTQLAKITLDLADRAFNSR
jgi:hypothetical protein